MSRNLISHRNRFQKKRLRSLPRYLFLSLLCNQQKSGSGVGSGNHFGSDLRSFKGWVQDTCSRFLFRIFAFLFSASCKGPYRIDTAYINDGYNISVFVSCKPRAPLKGRPPVASSRSYTARVGTPRLSPSAILNSSSFATLRISAEGSRCAHAF